MYIHVTLVNFCSINYAWLGYGQIHNLTKPPKNYHSHIVFIGVAIFYVLGTIITCLHWLLLVRLNVRDRVSDLVKK